MGDLVGGAGLRWGCVVSVLPVGARGAIAFPGSAAELGCSARVVCAAADPEKVIGLRPPTGRTDTPRCRKSFGDFDVRFAGL